MIYWMDGAIKYIRLISIFPLITSNDFYTLVN